MDFSSFFNNPFNGNRNNQTDSTQNQGADGEGKNSDNQQNGAVSPQDIFNFYQHKTQDELLTEILKQAASRRSEGTLADSDLENFYRQIAPFLSQDQRNKLDDVIKKLK